MTPPPGDRLPGCTFCDIVAHDVATDLVLDESSMVAFLDRRPVFPGHVLVVPRLHFETLVDLPLRLVEPLFATTRRVAGAVARAMEADGSLGAAAGSGRATGPPGRAGGPGRARGGCSRTRRPARWSCGRPSGTGPVPSRPWPRRVRGRRPPDGPSTRCWTVRRRARPRAS